jgi:hypothetical protein
MFLILNYRHNKFIINQNNKNKIIKMLIHLGLVQKKWRKMKNRPKIKTFKLYKLVTKICLIVPLRNKKNSQQKKN